MTNNADDFTHGRGVKSLEIHLYFFLREVKLGRQKEYARTEEKKFHLWKLYSQRKQFSTAIKLSKNKKGNRASNFDDVDKIVFKCLIQ